MLRMCLGQNCNLKLIDCVHETFEVELCGIHFPILWNSFEGFHFNFNVFQFAERCFLLRWRCSLPIQVLVLSFLFLTMKFSFNWILDNCRQGLSTRPVSSSDEIQLHIDPGADFDDEITGLRGQVRKLRNVFHYFPTSFFFSLPILKIFIYHLYNFIFSAFSFSDN